MASRRKLEKRSSGEFKTILNEGKSTVWRYFCSVVNSADSNEAVGYVQGKKCKVVIKYDTDGEFGSSMVVVPPLV